MLSLRQTIRIKQARRAHHDQDDDEEKHEVEGEHVKLILQGVGLHPLDDYSRWHLQLRVIFKIPSYRVQLQNGISVQSTDQYKSYIYYQLEVFSNLMRVKEFGSILSYSRICTHTLLRESIPKKTQMLGVQRNDRYISVIPTACK